MPTLHSAVHALAQTFVSSVLDAIKAASLGDLLADGGWGSSGRSVRGTEGHPYPLETPKRKTAGRLPRRSPEEIARTLDQVVDLAKASKKSLRSEEIRAALKLDKREMPRVIRLGLSTKKLRSKGQKRATVYSAA